MSAKVCSPSVRTPEHGVDLHAHQHSVQFYNDDAFLLDGLSRFVGSAVGAGDAVIIIATQAHRQELSNRLSIRGLDLARAVEQGRYITLDAADTLAQFMVEGRPDESRFVELIGPLITRAKAAAQNEDGRAALFGEMVALLWAEGHTEAAFRLEQLWNEIALSHTFSLLCAYPLSHFQREEQAEAFRSICNEHSAVIPAESYSLAPDEERPRRVAEWQQRALALDAEVSERKRAYDLLQAREAELRDFLENAVLPMHWVARDGTILWANKAEMDLLGFEPQEIIGHHIGEFHADSQAIEDILSRLARNEQLRGYEARLRCKDGSLRDVRIDSNVFTENGMFVHTRCFIIDITEQKKAEADRLLCAAIVRSSDDAIASKDLNGIVTSWNTAAEQMFGYKADEIVGQPILMIIPPELRRDEDMILGKIRRGERLEHFETVRVTKSGKRIDVSLTISPVKDGRGRVVGAAKIVRDITERKRTEEALRRAEKLAATGQLAAVIAHEINNPMQALTNVFALLARRTAMDADATQLVSVAESELSRMSHIARQMLSFYREPARPIPVKMTELIEGILELLALSWRANHIKVERRYEYDEHVCAFPVEVQQLFVNLLNNAAEAVGSRGRICVHVGMSRDWAHAGRRGVRVVIADNGPGIEPDIRKRVFEPFFTTKEQKGTGLGLWVVKGIVTKHEGSLRLRTSTSPGRSGTVISVFFPGQENSEAAISAQVAPKSEPRPTAG
jgi:PAS domain S-box-containing protein